MLFQLLAGRRERRRAWTERRGCAATHTQLDKRALALKGLGGALWSVVGAVEASEIFDESEQKFD